ncbi:hypothetical protein [Kibdelosporangium philippinense]|uniref:hypothetical protein n=1 Tax=Kibdelosporangium philippinense TaxID=211113 RepID=UPI0036108C35
MGRYGCGQDRGVTHAPDLEDSLRIARTTFVHVVASQPDEAPRRCKHCLVLAGVRAEFGALNADARNPRLGVGPGTGR